MTILEFIPWIFMNYSRIFMNYSWSRKQGSVRRDCTDAHPGQLSFHCLPIYDKYLFSHGPAQKGSLLSVNYGILVQYMYILKNLQCNGRIWHWWILAWLPLVMHQSFVTMTCHPQGTVGTFTLGYLLFFQQIPARSSTLPGKTVGKTSAIWPGTAVLLLSLLFWCKNKTPHSPGTVGMMRRLKLGTFSPLSPALPHSWGSWLQIIWCIMIMCRAGGLPIYTIQKCEEKEQ